MEITSEKPYDERATLIGATVSAADPGEMIRADTFARDSLIVAINFRTSCPAACDISFRTRRTALKLFIDRLLLQQFQRRDKNGHAYTQNTVHPADMPEFVGIGQMSAVPRHEKIAAMKRRSRKMKGISLRIIRHHVMSNVGIYNLSYGIIEVDERQIGDQR